MSLWATGTPCSGPSLAPARCAASAASAAASAPSRSTSTKQFTVPFRRVMRSRQASTTSRAVVRRSAIARAVSVSEARDQSVMGGHQRQQDGAEVGGIDIEVDLAVHAFDGAAELLELDRQLLDTRR